MTDKVIKYTMVKILRYIENCWLTFEEIRDDFGYEPEHIQEALDELMSRNLIIYDGKRYELPDDVYALLEYIQFNAILNSRLLINGYYTKRIDGD